MEHPKLNIGEGEIFRSKIECTELEDGTPVILPYFVMRGKRRRPILLLNAAIHGDELNGIEVIHRIFEEIKPEEISGTILAVPVVNTLAFRARSRVDPVDGKNLNRVFPGRKNGTVTERIAYHFFEKFVKKADYGIDLHTGMKGHLLVPHPRIRVVPGYNPPIEHARALGTEVLFYHEGHPGMLNVAAGKRGIPIVCFEIGEAGRIDEYFIEAGVKGVKNFMRYIGMLPGKVEIPENQILLKDYMEINSSIGGIFYSKVKAGDVVRERQIIGMVKSPFTGEKRNIYAPKNGFVLGIRSQPLVRPGTAAAWLMGFDQGTVLPPLQIKNNRNDVKEVESRTFHITKERGIEIK
ncbi:MAG: succinylglutamate desuccinylase/aspartoacylase family protein [Thermoplasmata archaeon]|nr:succinylglutamate desuccinylase/aspartoacylase family protein [Thermoplasmata archaeon]